MWAVAYHGHAMSWLEVDPDPAESMSVALEDLRQRLRRSADDAVNAAISVQLLAVAGYRASEIKTQLGLSDADYAMARRWLIAACA
jgi:hypothetical protein